MKGFHLDKWYLDCVDEKGLVFIGYAARLRWRKISLSYQGYIIKDDSRFHQFSSLTKGVLPKNSNSITWETPTINGEWQSSESEIHEFLLGTPQEPEIVWRCIQPNSHVTLFQKGKLPIKGRGYVENIRLDIAPWNLPIKELFWGRFVSVSYTLIWIEWRGKQPKKMAFINGVKSDEIEIFEKSVRLKEMIVFIDTSQVIRSGTIGLSVFARLQRFLSFIPKKIFGLNEQKWGGLTFVTQGDKVLDHGNFIHERVVWP